MDSLPVCELTLAFLVPGIVLARIAASSADIAMSSPVPCTGSVAVYTCRKTCCLGLEKMQSWARLLVNSHTFFVAMMVVIVLNLAALSLSVHPPWIDQVIGEF